MGKLDELWSKTAFDKSDPGEVYCEMLIREGTSQPLVDLADDAPLPSYFDREKFKRAQDYYTKYRVFILTTNVIGVMILFGIESILDILACSKQSSTPVSAFKRYAETMLYIMHMYESDPEDQKSKCYRSILAVRKKHRHGSQIGVLRVNQFINQRDMAVTQNSFMGHVVACHDTFGMPYDPENFLALCHFWRVIGYMLGIEDRFNLCAGDNLAEIKSRSQAIFRHMIVPGMLHAPSDFQMMTDAYFEGLGGLSSEFEPEKFIYISKKTSLVPGFYITEEECQQQKLYMKKYAHYIPDAKAILGDMKNHPKRCKAFEALKWSNRWDIIFTNYLLLNIVPKSPLLRNLFNFIHSVRIFFLKHFPVLAMWKFGYSNAWVSVLKE